MISLAMATYNGNKYIIEQLESLKNQLLKFDEVIIIDDCSTDNTYEIVNNFIIKNNLYDSWHLYKNKKNMGYIYTFRESIKKTTGDIIFLCDQDDIWLENKSFEMFRIMDQNNKILALSSSFNQIDDCGFEKKIKSRFFTSNNGIIRKRIKKEIVSQIDLKRVFTYNISPGCTSAFKKDIKNEFLKYELNVPHDWQINIIAATKQGLYFYNKSLTKYRIHENNTIGIKHVNDIQKRIQNCKKDIFEKKEIKEYLTKSKFNLDSYYIKIINIYNNRLKVLTKKNFLFGIYNILLSFFKNGLIDSTIMDLFVVIKSKVI